MSKLLRRMIAVATAAVVLIALPTFADAAPKKDKVHPDALSCDGPGRGGGQNAQARWTNSAVETGGHSVLLRKLAETTNCSAAEATIRGVEGLTVAELGDIGFSVSGQCTGGSPRYNLDYDTDGDGEADGTAFYGCANHIVGPGAAPGWSVVLVDAETADNGQVPGTATVLVLEVVQDEQGTSYVDNLVFAGQTVGEPNGSS
jgi:hypothetical protein